MPAHKHVDEGFVQEMNVNLCRHCALVSCWETHARAHATQENGDYHVAVDWMPLLHVSPSAWEAHGRKCESAMLALSTLMSIARSLS
jgi:hypothetical protein